MIRTGFRTAEVEIPCTCGELVQGVLGGEPFLVSCPIDRYSRVKVALDGESQVRATPSKARRAAEAALSALGHGGRSFSLDVSCPLPPSKGFGTSTADVVGAITAASVAAGAALVPIEVARLAVSIEPSDGTMFPGLAILDHRSARDGAVLGSAPPLLIAVLEFEGTVDTLEYNSRLDITYLRSREPEYIRAVELLRRGLQGGRWDLVGQAATLSARINQRMLPKPELERAIQLGEAHGALGVCAAHSGTLLGVLFGPEQELQARALMASAQTRLKGLERCWMTRLVDGGPRVVSAGAVPEPRMAAIPSSIGTTETRRTRRFTE